MAGMTVPLKNAQFCQGDTATCAALKTTAGILKVNDTTGAMQVTTSAGGGTIITDIPVGANVQTSTSTRAAIVQAAEVDLICTDPAGTQAGFGERTVYKLSVSDATLQSVASMVVKLTTATAGAIDSAFQWAIDIANVAQTAWEISTTTTNDESVGVLLIRQGGVFTAKRIKQGPDTSGPGGANRALYVVT